MDYEKKIREYLNSDEVDQLYKSMLINLFPELAESEDEKIRKEIIDYIKHIKGQTISIEQYDSWIPWLKSLKDRCLPQPKKEFDKEDQETLRFILKDLCDELDETTGEGDREVLNREIAFLRSLEPQPKQKWSEEDVKNLQWLDTICERIYHRSDPQVAPNAALKLREWLKSLSPQKQWKPSEEQIAKDVAEKFARVIRGNLSVIDESVQVEIEQIYKEVTGENMYGGFID